MSSSELFSKKNIASFTLIFMSVQIGAFEGGGISMPKVVYMCISPILILFFSPKISKAIFFSILFWTITFFLQIIQYDNVRMSTLYYSAMFLSVFCLFYNLVWKEHCFELDDYLKVVQGVIIAYALVAVLQQLALLLGIRYLTIINVGNQDWLNLFRLNSLAIEPSHAARILTVYFYSFLKLTEYKCGHPIAIGVLWGNYRFLVISFLYTMIVIGSGTAIVGLAILALYFLKPQYISVILLFAVLFYIIAPSLDYDPFNRAINAFNLAIQLDEEGLVESDNSAASRVNTLISIIKYTDFSDLQLWLGYGEYNPIIVAKTTSYTHPMIINYGLISYFLKLLFFISCSFCGLFSLSTIMFILLFTMYIGNIAYGFAALMVFSGVKYFQCIYKK